MAVNLGEPQSDRLPFLDPAMRKSCKCDLGTLVSFHASLNLPDLTKVREHEHHSGLAGLKPPYLICLPAKLMSMCTPLQAAKQVLDRVLPKPVSYADLCAIAGAVGVFNTGGPLINVGYGRPDVEVSDPNQGVSANTNQQKDYPIAELMNEWSEPPQPCLQSLAAAFPQMQTYAP